LNSRICAHRGFARLYPENTLASVRAALNLGVKWVEIDVQLTKDQVPVAYHDVNLRRVSGRSGDIRHLNWAQVRHLSAFEPGRFGKKFRSQRVASLKQMAALVASYKGARLFVELKEESLKRFGRLEMLAEVHGALKILRRRAVLISFDEPVLALARQATTYPVGFVLRNRKQLKSNFYKNLKPEFVFSDVASLPKRGSLRLRGVIQCLWEVPDPKVAQAAFKRGMDMIETFAVDHYL
jgi:glycerophosphoryl diester phosphodiesterase